MQQELIEVVKELRKAHNESDEYLQSIPPDLRCVFYDNVHVSNLEYQKDLLIKKLFGKDSEDVFWFLYEFEPGRSPGPHCITADGKEWFYKTDEDYYKYLETL